MSDSFEIIKKGDILRYYDSLSPDLREKAYNSYQIWLKNPKWHGKDNPLLMYRMFSDLIKSKYFFPASDDNLILKIFRPVMERNKNEHFMMIRLSQNAKPLTWVLASGKNKVINKARIGVELIPGTKRVNYTVDMGEKNTYQSTNLEVIIEILRALYIKTNRTYAWSLLSNKMI